MVKIDLHFPSESSRGPPDPKAGAGSEQVLKVGTFRHPQSETRIQNPNPKFQENPNQQIPTSRRPESPLDIEFSLGFGASQRDG
jgi:hypothetical protein